MNWISRLIRPASPGESGFKKDTPSSGSTTASTGKIASQLAARSSPTLDLIDGVNVLAAYYQYVEGRVYVAALKTARERRDFRDELLRRLTEFLRYENDAQARDLIEFELQKEEAALSSGLVVHTEDPLTEAARLQPKGVGLLNLSTPVTWEGLKSGYRAAAKVHHPDVGGDNATMQCINDAYALLSMMLKRQAAYSDAGQSMWYQVQTSKQVFVNARLQMFSLFLDDLAADRAYEIYRSIGLTGVDWEYNGVFLAARLCELLSASGMKAEATSVLSDLANLRVQAENKGLNVEPVCERAANAVADPKSIRFVPNHMRQVSNLLRLGVIDQKRFSALQKRIEDTREKTDDASREFSDFVRTYEFHKLPVDAEDLNGPVNGLVPPPDYYSRVESLSSSQRVEYAQAFFGNKPELAAKYLAVRIDALLRAPFQGYRDTKAVLEELCAIEAAPGIKPALRALCDEAKAVVEFLLTLPNGERQRRIQLLNSLDAQPGVIELRINANGVSIMPRPIFLNRQFTTFAVGPLDRIERYIRTGSEDTSEEREAKDRSRIAAREFYESAVYKRARDIAWAGNQDPQAAVDAICELCEAMYGRVEDVGNEALDIGYWTDKLTVAMAKLKRFEDALCWLRRFETLPDSVRDRTSRGVLASLSKRKVRCEKELARRPGASGP